MLPSYDDIREAIPAPPLWFDGNGVPRYAPFDPDMLGVYDKICVLYQIECQSCSQQFLVGEGWTDYDLVWGHEEPVTYKIEDVCAAYHYGDPPRHGCVGDTMNCIDLTVVQAWERNKDYLDFDHPYLRRNDLEGPMDLPEWAK